MLPDEMPDDFRTITQRLRTERQMTMEDLVFAARRHPPQGAVSLSMMQKRLAPGSRAAPSIEMLEALATALGVPPDTYPEWRLAQARRSLEERQVGLVEALATLALVEPHLTARSRAS
jgi:transcriptional regulator with XRE-family HTH domain